MLFGSKDKKIEHAIEKKNPAGVIGFLEDKDEHIRMMAIEAAGKIGGDDCMNALIPLLHNADAKTRAAAATALAERSAFSTRESWPGMEAAGVPARRE